MGAPIGVTVALGAVGWVNPLGTQWGLWGGYPRWGQHGAGGCGVGEPIGVTVGAMGWVPPLGSPLCWGLWGV